MALLVLGGLMFAASILLFAGVFWPGVYFLPAALFLVIGGVLVAVGEAGRGQV